MQVRFGAMAPSLIEQGFDDMDVIERGRAEVGKVDAVLKDMADEIERLRAALETVRDQLGPSKREPIGGEAWNTIVDVKAMRSVGNVVDNALGKMSVKRTSGRRVGCGECGDEFWDRAAGDKCPSCGEALVEISVCEGKSDET